MSYTRRDVLRGAAGVAAATVTVGSVAAQEENEHWQAQPDHVTLAYDEPTLVNYDPPARALPGGTREVDAGSGAGPRARQSTTSTTTSTSRCTPTKMGLAH